MEETGQSQNKLKTTKKLSEKWFFAIGLITILSTEFISRDVLLPEQPKDLHIGIALLVEWLILLFLLLYWIPKVEGKRLNSIGFGKFKGRYFWMSILTYIILMGVWTVSSFGLKAIGLEGLSSLQPMIKNYNPLTLSGLFITGTFLEEVFYRGYLIERLTFLTGQRRVGTVISWLTFTLVHLKFFGLGPTLEVSILSAALVLLYIKEKSIWPCIVVHGINDAFGFLIFPLLLS